MTGLIRLRVQFLSTSSTAQHTHTHKPETIGGLVRILSCHWLVVSLLHLFMLHHQLLQMSVLHQCNKTSRQMT